MLRLLIIKPSSLGDIVHGLQVAATLHAQVPGLRIDWVARDVFAPLVAHATCVERVHVFERRGGARGFWRLLRRLRATRYDHVFDLQGLLRSGVMTAAARAGLKTGRSDAREGAGIFYDRRVPLPAGGRASHALDILLQFCPVLGVPAVLGARVGFRAAEERPRPFAEGGSGPIVLFPDSRRPEKCWPGFRELTADLLRRRPDLRLVWAGSEPHAADPAWPGERFANLTARTPLGALPELIGGAALVVANDSGPMHLAAALGVPVLGLFGPTDPRRYGPYPSGGDGRHVLVAPGGDLARLEVRTVANRIEGALGSG